MTSSAPDKPEYLFKVLAIGLALLILCAASCRKSVDPNKLMLQSKPAAPPPSAANVIQIAPPPEAAPPPVTLEHTEPPQNLAGQSESVGRPQFLRHWLMLVAALTMLFLLSLLIFHTMGRRLRRRSFKPHPPTSHADIWASHKPPEFLDP